MRQRFWLRSTTDWNKKRFFEVVCGRTTRSGRCRLFVIAFELECFFLLLVSLSRLGTLDSSGLLRLQPAREERHCQLDMVS